jgi:hypothetical protein
MAVQLEAVLPSGKSVALVISLRPALYTPISLHIIPEKFRSNAVPFSCKFAVQQKMM